MKPGSKRWLAAEMRRLADEVDPPAKPRHPVVRLELIDGHGLLAATVLHTLSSPQTEVELPDHMRVGLRWVRVCTALPHEVAAAAVGG